MTRPDTHAVLSHCQGAAEALALQLLACVPDEALRSCDLQRAIDHSRTLAGMIGAMRDSTPTGIMDRIAEIMP